MVTITYFDYFTNTVKFLQVFASHDYTYGSGYVSSLWGYVSRGLYSSKPDVYGALRTVDLTFPGAIERQAYPAMLGWVLAYMDFGVVGVIFCGLVVGVFNKAIYTFYLQNKDNLFLFSWMIQVGGGLYFYPQHGELYLLIWYYIQQKFFIYRFLPKRLNVT